MPAAVHMALQAITSPNLFPKLGGDWSWDEETHTKAIGYAYQLESSKFLQCIKILFEGLSCLKSLTVKLQLRAMAYANKEVNDVISILDQ